MADKLVKMTDAQYEVARQLLSLKPTEMTVLIKLLTKAKTLNGLGDYENWLQDQLVPAEGFVKPFGPANFPITTPPQVKTAADVLNELIKQRTATRPLIRSKDVTQTGVTLDWTASGLMTRLVIRNKGTNSVWMAFDQDGQSVDAKTSNNSVEIQANESWNLELCAFSKLGLRCAAGQTATCHAIAWPGNSGNMAGAVA